MDNNIYYQAIQKVPCSFAYHQAVYDEQGRMVDYIFKDINDAFLDSTGLNREEIIGRRFVRDVLKDPKNGEKWIRIYEKVVKEELEVAFEDYSEEFGKHFIIKAYPSGKDHFATVFHDKSSLEKSGIDAAFRADQKMFYTLAEYAPIGFMACNVKGEILYANTKLLEVMDSPSYEATKAINLLEFQPLKESGFSRRLKESMEKNRKSTFEMPYRSMWGRESWVRVHFTPHQEGEKVIGASIVVDDVTEEKKTEEYLKEKALRDPLTRAYNRNGLDTILKELLQKGEDSGLVGCLAVLDVDDFKNINDGYGHWAGDSVLKYLATRIKKELREQDLIVRTGGDEFLIYLHDIGDQAHGDSIMGRIHEKISTRYRLEDLSGSRQFSLKVGCSMGVAFFPQNGRNVETLMARADEALYQVKRNGKAGYALYQERKGN